MPQKGEGSPDAGRQGQGLGATEIAKALKMGAQVWSTYDALNRRGSKAPPGQASITYGYDLTGRLLSAKASTDASAYQITYDTAGRAARKMSETMRVW